MRTWWAQKEKLEDFLLGIFLLKIERESLCVDFARMGMLGVCKMGFFSKLGRWKRRTYLGRMEEREKWVGS